MKTTYAWNPETRKFEAIGGSSAHRKQVHSIIQDSMNATWHPANGKMIDSKSHFRKVTRDHGCHEVGNDEQTQKPREPTDSDYEKAVIQAYETPDYNRKPVDRNNEFSDTVMRNAIEKARSDLNK